VGDGRYYAAGHGDDRRGSEEAAAVPFSHLKHTKYAKSCDRCHHDAKGLTASANATVKKCSACHLDPKGKTPSMRDVSLTANPLHESCIACHKEQRKGPTACVACHVKKK
jgi:hypothetical protein